MNGKGSYIRPLRVINRCIPSQYLERRAHSEGPRPRGSGTKGEKRISDLPHEKRTARRTRPMEKSEKTTGKENFQIFTRKVGYEAVKKKNDSEDVRWNERPITDWKMGVLYDNSPSLRGGDSDFYLPDFCDSKTRKGPGLSRSRAETRAQGRKKKGGGGKANIVSEC